MPNRLRFIPRPFAVICVLAIVVAVIAATSRLAGHGGIPVPAQAVRSAGLLMEDRPDGAIVVTQAGHPGALDVVPPASNGFLRVILAGLVRERRREGIGARRCHSTSPGGRMDA